MPKYFHGGEIHALIVDAKMCSVEVILKAGPERKQGLCVLVVITSNTLACDLAPSTF